MYKLLLLLLFIPCNAQANIYKHTDKNGITIYSEHPSYGKESILIKEAPLNIINSQNSSIKTKDNLDTKQSSEFKYSSLSLRGIPTNKTLRANDGTLNISVHTVPELRKNHQFQLKLDDHNYGKAQDKPLFTLQNIDRGEHKLSVEILSEKQVIQRSPVTIFTLQRVSRNNFNHLPRSNAPISK